MEGNSLLYGAAALLGSVPFLALKALSKTLL